MKFDEFTLVVQLDFYRINNHITLSAQLCDGLLSRECAAECACHVTKTTEYGDYSHLGTVD